MNRFDKLEKELFDRVLGYAKSGRNRKRICCKKHSQSCGRFLRFLDSDDYYFDKKELCQFYMWCTQFTHRMGVLKGTPIYLADVQLFWASNILCLKKRKNDLRKTAVVYIQVGRKNSKTQFMAFLVSYFLFVKGGQEIYLSGWNKEGSSILFREIEHILRSSRFLEDKWKLSYGNVVNLKDGGFVKPLSKDAKNNDNANNPTVAIVDEFKDHLTNEIWDNLKTGMIAQPEGLLLTITTAGANINCPCKEMYDNASKILDPDIDLFDDGYFIDIHEMEENDRYDDKSLWIKANPIVATYDKGIENLQSAFNLAKMSETNLRLFLTKNMNVWVDMAENGYMNMSKWKACEGVFDYSVFSKGDVYCGVDLSAKNDLTAVVFGVKVKYRYYFKQQSFLPEFRYNELINKGENFWYGWKKEGGLIVTKGDVIDIYDIVSYIEDFRKRFNANIVEIDYDSWSATQFAQEMEKLGYLTVEIRQGIRTLGEGTARFREEVYKGNVVHEKDGLYSFCMSNCILREDSNKNFMIDKKRSKNKIDPVAATMNVASRIFFVEEKVDINEVAEDWFELMEF